MKNSFNLLVITFLLTGCLYEPINDKLKVINQTSEKVYFIVLTNKALREKYDIKAEKQGFILSYKSYLQEIEPQDTFAVTFIGREDIWESEINTTKDKKLKIYNFNIDTLQKYNWKEVLENEQFEKKLEFTIDDLNKANWHVKITND